MAGKKINRRELFKLLPGGILSALAGVAVAVAAEEETVEVKPDVDYDQLAAAILDAPLDTDMTEKFFAPDCFGLSTTTPLDWRHIHVADEMFPICDKTEETICLT